MMISNKRGVSPVVAEVLLVMITIAAIGIVAGFVIPFIRDNLNESTECVNYEDYFTFQEVFKFGTENLRYNCKVDGKYGISVKANSDTRLAEEIAGFNIVLVGRASSEAIKIEGGKSIVGIHMMGGLDKTVLEIPKSGEVRSYVYSSQSDFNKMEVYPILKSGRVCEMSDSIDISTCIPNVIGAGEIE